jgi:methylsterol monooxygenase
MDALYNTFNSTLEGLVNPQTAVYGADLYKGVDPSSLNWFEQQWANYYMWIGNPVIATGLMSFLLHEIVYFGRAVSRS